MDDNNLATSEAIPQDEVFASEDVTPKAETVEAPAEPSAPKSNREALEEAFKQAEDKAKGVQPQAQTPVEQKPMEPAPAPGAFKAPQSWKADRRMKFEALDQDVKEEIIRRENEISTYMNQTATERRLAQEFINVAAPFEQHYRSMGINGLKAAQMLFQAEHTMRVGNVAQKAAVVGKLINDYGIDLDALNEVINGRQPKEQPGQQSFSQADVQRMVQEQIAQQSQRTAHESQQSQLNTQIDQFANDPKNEFFNDVAPAMIGLLQSGAAADLQTAYEQACYANPSVRKAMADREAANKQRLQAAGASLPVKGPRTGTSAQPAQRFKTTRDALEAAWAASEKQGRV